MDFAALPPEVNSGLMYAGPGAAPMLAAGAAWDGLAAELHSAATAYESVISALATESWLGASSAAMAAAAAPYAGWLAGTATQAEQTANQARAAAAAYEAAFGMTVPPLVIAANRAQLMALVATNVFGQNTPAIAAAEVHYLQMWAQDAVAMYGYAGAAAAAAELTPFTLPTHTAAAMSAEALPAAVPAAAPSLATLIPAAALAVSSTTAAVNPSIAGAAWNAAATNSRILVGNTEGILDNGAELHVMESEILNILHGARAAVGLSSATSLSPGFAGGTIPVSAGFGQAVSAGKLSVPLNWAVATPEIRTASYTLPTASVAVTALAETPTSAFSQMALAGMGGSALAGSVKPGRPDGAAVAFGQRVATAPDAPAESPEQPPESPVAELVAGIRQLSELRDSGLLSAAEFDEQKQRLLRRPLPS